MGGIVILTWLAWIIFLVVHIQNPTLIPLRIRVLSFYVPMGLTTVYAFSLGTFLGYFALLAAFVHIWDDVARRKEMS